MDDVTEAIIKRIRLMPNPPCHVGEVIPQDIAKYPYVFIMKNSEVYADDLCYPRVKESISYDVEVVSDDIDETRHYSSEIKNWLMATEMHSLVFSNDDGLEQTIHGLLVDDHDDSYTIKYPDSDERLFIGAIDVEAVLGQLT